MALENKLGLASSADLAREEERISKKKAVALFEKGLLDQLEAGTFSCENYGVRISEDGGDSSAVPGITTSALRIDELMTLLVEHGVGPSTLRDVVDDWL